MPTDSFYFPDPCWALHAEIHKALSKYSLSESIGGAGIFRFAAPNDEPNIVEIDMGGSRQDEVGKPFYTVDIQIRYTTMDRFVFESEHLDDEHEGGLKEFGEEWAILTFLTCKATERAREPFEHIEVSSLQRVTSSVDTLDNTRVTHITTLPFRARWKISRSR